MLAQITTQRTTKVVTAILLFSWPYFCFAAGFRTPLGNVEQLGLAGAGEAAQADDASTVFSNVAGMTRIKKREIASSNAVVLQSGTFTGTVGKTYGVADTETKPINSRAFYMLLPLKNNLAVGMSMTSPFGLGIQFPGNSIVKNIVTLQKLETINLGPGIAYKIQHLSLGAGFDAQYAQSVSRSVLPLPPTVRAVGIVKNNSFGWGWGWHAGLLYEFTDSTRLGLTYHSPVRHHFAGVSNAIPFLPANDDFNFNLPFPASTGLSFYHDFNQHWAAMATIDYTQWDILKQLNINNSAQGTLPPIILNFHNTFRFAVGTQYNPTPKWSLRTGISTERTPTNDFNRNLVIQPDANTINFAFGFHHQMLEKLGLDFSYTYTLFQPAPINNTFGNTPVVGTYNNSSNVIGAGIVVTL